MSDSIFLTDGNGTITGLVDTAYAGELIIPEYVAGERITAIGGRAFRRNVTLTSVTLPSSVTSIISGAFGECPSLASITIPNSVTSIGRNAFNSCSSLTTVYVDDPNNLSEAVSTYDWSSTGSSGITFKKIIKPIEVNKLVINKLTLDQYKTAKSEGLADDEVYVVTDVDEAIDAKIEAAIGTAIGGSY